MADTIETLTTGSTNTHKHLLWHGSDMS